MSGLAHYLHQNNITKQHLSILQKNASSIKNDAHHDRIQQWRSFSGYEFGRSHVYTSATICNYALDAPSTPLIVWTLQRHLVINIPPMLSSSPLHLGGNSHQRIYPACKLKLWL
jgi:hypothetical protein